MQIKNWKKLELKENVHKIDARPLYDKEDAQVVHILLQAGQSLKPHITPVDVFFFIIEGRPTIQVGEEKVMVEENDLVESPKDIVHCIYNETEQNVRVLVVKTPRPKNPSKVL
jgi:mannose-6-phosphate isomerase-like protein (cupin superfamily)